MARVSGASSVVSAPPDFARTIPIVALDMPTAADALALVDALGESCRFYKIGSQLFTNAGPSVVESLVSRGCEVFLDLKFHDIPNTVRGACQSAAKLGVSLVTVHATGGREMLEHAVEGARESERCRVLAVTVLTSLSAPEVNAGWGRTDVVVEREVVRLAGKALGAGVDGLVCAGTEVGALRAAHGPTPLLVVPGIRLPGDPTADQARVVTPRVAAAAGASHVVIGRTVSGAPDPATAMRRVIAELATVVE
jgi:orotidine-5'-phosphate decarboxylase